VDLYGNYLFLQGTESVFIKRNILALGAQYQILFVAADQMDVARVATDYVTIKTLPAGQKLVQITLYSEANMNNNQINIFEK
jgi:predicted RNase H-like nuclease (RuvC/YqgF family)